MRPQVPRFVAWVGDISHPTPFDPLGIQPHNDEPRTDGIPRRTHHAVDEGQPPIGRHPRHKARRIPRRDPLVNIRTEQRPNDQQLVQQLKIRH